MLAFLRSHLRLLGYGLVALCVGLVLWPRRADDTGWEAYSHAIAQASARKMAADAQALRQADSALAQRDGTVTRTVTKYRTIRDTLDIHDTVQVKVFVARSDSVVRACTELQSACAVFHQWSDSVLADVTQDRDAWKLAAKAAQPSRLGALWNRVKVPGAFILGAWVGAKVTR